MVANSSIRLSIVITQLTLVFSSGLPPFDVFVKQFQRSYQTSAEYHEREAVYSLRRNSAKQQNSRSGKLWTAGVNKRWDWTESEIQNLHGMLNARDAPRTNDTLSARSQGGSSINFAAEAASQVGSANRSDLSLPAEQSWAHLSAWSAYTQDQGSCGSCWAITAAGLLQAHSEIYAASPRSFSVQEFVSCVPNPKECGGTGGCKGATVSLALDWALKHGVSEEHEEPYRSGQSGEAGTCLFARGASTQLKAKKKQLRAFGGVMLDRKQPRPSLVGFAFGMTGWEKLPENRYEPLMRALVERGPVAVSVASNQWLLYESGIFDGCMRPSVVNHAVVLLAYGVGGGTQYWTVQNSWGHDWGETGGRMRLLRSAGHEEDWCGTDYQPEVGTGCKDGPSKVTVCGMCGILYSPVVPHFA